MLRRCCEPVFEKSIMYGGDRARREVRPFAAVGLSELVSNSTRQAAGARVLFTSAIRSNMNDRRNLH